jgi:hypothetical protein
MAEIYLGSCLTIAATASVDSTGGFFLNRWTSQPGGIKSNIETFEFHRTFSGADFTVYARQGLDSVTRECPDIPPLPQIRRLCYIAHGLIRSGYWLRECFMYVWKKCFGNARAAQYANAAISLGGASTWTAIYGLPSEVPWP